MRVRAVRAGDVWLNPSYRESRAMHDVHFLLLGHLFGLGYRRVERLVDAGDTDARTYLPLAGFHLEGVLRKHMVVKVRKKRRRGGCGYSFVACLLSFDH